MNGIISRRRLLYAVSLSALLMPWGCGRKADRTGKWEGPLDFSSIVPTQGKSAEATFHIVLDIRREGEALKVSMGTVEQGPEEYPVDHVEILKDTITVTSSKRPIRYQATFSSDGTEMHGSLKQGPYVFPLTLKKVPGS
jgi:hypothetical protein